MAVDRESSKDNMNRSDDLMGALTLSWVLNWLRRRRIQGPQSSADREWQVSGRSLDSLTWSDFKAFFRAVARKVLGVSPELDVPAGKDENKALRRSREHSTAAVDVLPADSGRTSTLFEHQLEPAAEVKQEVRCPIRSSFDRTLARLAVC